MEVFTELAFRVRSALTWSLPAFRRVVPLSAAAEALDAPARARLEALSSRYELAPWSAVCGRQAWRESLYALDVLSRALPATLPPGRALEIGAKNGSMIPALATATGRGVDAVELDAHRRYVWGSTRRVYGEAMARGFSDSRFIAGDVRSLEGPWAVAMWWLPFVTVAPLSAWGLPTRHFAPLELLRHVTSRLVPGGALLVVNQGEAEAEAQAALFAQVGGRARALGPVTSALSPFTRPRLGWLWEPG